MSEWPMIALESVMVKRGGSVDPSKYPDEHFELYSIPAFDHGAPEVVAGSEIGSTKQIVEPGDVLLSRIVPHIRRAWVVGERSEHRIIASGEWMVFRSDEFDPDWLRHILVGDRFHAQLMQTVAGVGGSLMRARPAHVSLIEVPMPPIEEQRRIAAILDHTDALRAKRHEALARLDELTQSIFIDMFGDPTRKQHWELMRFGDACISRLGKMLDQKQQTGNHVRPYLRNANVQWFRIDTDDLLKMDFDEKSRVEFRLEPGDVLMCEGGEPGRSAIWREQVAECYYQKALHRIRPNPDLLTPEYLVRLFWFLSRGGTWLIT